MLMFYLRDNAGKMKWLPNLVGDSCGKLQNSENCPCFLINSVVVYTLISNIEYCKNATARSVENFAIIFEIVTTVVSYKWSEHIIDFLIW